MGIAHLIFIVTVPLPRLSWVAFFEPTILMRDSLRTVVVHVRPSWKALKRFSGAHLVYQVQKNSSFRRLAGVYS